MKRYTVNVHYDAVVTVVVEAEDEEQALDLAPTAAESISLEDAVSLKLKKFLIFRKLHKSAIKVSLTHVVFF